MKARRLLEAAGASLLIVLPLFCPLLFPGHTILLHHSLAFRNVAGGLLIDFLGIFVVAVAALILLARVPPLPRRVLAALFAAIFLCRFLELCVDFLEQSYQARADNGSLLHHSLRLEIFGYWPILERRILIFLVLFLILLAWLRPAISQSVVGAVRIGLAGFAFCGIWVFSEMLYLALALHVPTSRNDLRMQSTPHVDQRIVWILFDELSENLLIDHPPPGQRFRNFEKLRDQSVTFADIQPSGFFTERVIPSLLAGHQISQVRSTLDGALLELNAQQHRWEPYDADASLFSEAAARGWNPGVAGWYIPYCRLFSNFLSSCSWEQPFKLPAEALGASEQKSIVENALVIPWADLRLALLHRQVSPTYLQDRIAQYRNLMKGAENLIQNDQVRFIFIHLPVPHPPGIFNRSTHQICECGNYIDNLSLADDTLGILMQEIEQTPSGDNTTIIVSSDHSWRVFSWKNSFGWTEEEDRISKKQFDPRPVFLIHFPGQSSEGEVNTVTPELTEHDIIAAMLKNEISRPEQLDAFLHSSTQQ